MGELLTLHIHKRLTQIPVTQKKQQEAKEISGAVESPAEEEAAKESEDSMKTNNDEKLASEPTKKPQLILKESDKTPERKTSVVQRPKRNAAIRARDKMINMR